MVATWGGVHEAHTADPRGTESRTGFGALCQADRVLGHDREGGLGLRGIDDHQSGTQVGYWEGQICYLAI